jgi:hypothetical protein
MEAPVGYVGGIEPRDEVDIGRRRLRKGEPPPICLAIHTTIPGKSNTSIISVTIFPWVSVGLGILKGAEDIEVLMESVALPDGPGVNEQIIRIERSPSGPALVNRSAD